ncbi:MAG: DUF5916 domain-containing protein [Chitinophagales bacterium]
MKKLFILLFLYLISNPQTYSQDSMTHDPIIVKRSHEKIVLDGNLDEKAWETGSSTQDFWQYFPSDSIQAKDQTEIYFHFDEETLYVGAKCYSAGEDYVTPSLRRDYQAGGSDNLTLMFDTFNDRTNCIFFGVNPAGVLREGLIANGGNRGSDFSTSWDQKWDGAVQIHDGYWTAEVAIPFKILRYKSGNKTWHFNAYRFDTQSNEITTLMHIPREQAIMGLAFMGEMQWEEAPPKAGANISVIPYSIGNITKDFEANEAADKKVNAGLDAKVAVSSGLNLDLTVNPDFSQVEVDAQVTNLDRFEIFFPERRQFFLENADLFGAFGDNRANPFFSRRIGIAEDTINDENIANAIHYGARLSGKLDQNWRVGLLNMQTSKEESIGLPSTNYTVAAIQRKLFSRSNIGMIFVNKQAFGSDTSDYNRIIGLDYNLASSDNRWTGKFYLHKAFTLDNSVDSKLSNGASLSYRVRKYRLSLRQQWVGDGFDAEVGFVPRKDFLSINPSFGWFIFPKKGSINRHEIEMDSRWFWRPDYGKTDNSYSLNWNASFDNNARLNAEISNNYVFLFDDFDPTRTDSNPLPAETDYSFTNFSMSFSSDRRKKISFRLQPSIGQFFNGNRYGLSGNLTYRYQPYGFVAMNFNVNQIDLPEPYAKTTLVLVGPRVDLTLTKSLFLTTFLQYNNQTDNMNVNARLQWRYAPVSDLFLVYTDNYDTGNGFMTKNRALILKVNYWLNL